MDILVPTANIEILITSFSPPLLIYLGPAKGLSCTVMPYARSRLGLIRLYVTVSGIHKPSLMTMM
jgi:hypothetical protein